MKNNGENSPLCLYQLIDGYCYNSDSLILYDFAHRRFSDPRLFAPKRRSIIDIGAGCGILGLLFARAGYRVCMVEKDAYMSYLARINARGFKEARVINADFLEVGHADFDLWEGARESADLTPLRGVLSKSHSIEPIDLKTDSTKCILSKSDSAPTKGVLSKVDSTKCVESKVDSTKPIDLKVDSTPTKGVLSKPEKSPKSPAFSFAIFNPPFYSSLALEGQNPRINTARFEHYLPLSKLLAGLRGLLHAKARIAFIYDASQLDMVLCALKEEGFGSVCLQFVHPKKNALAKTFMVCARLGGRGRMEVLAPLFLSEANKGADASKHPFIPTKCVDEIYRRANLHSIKVHSRDIDLNNGIITDELH